VASQNCSAHLISIRLQKNKITSTHQMPEVPMMEPS
jgi:hypothetical protein